MCPVPCPAVNVSTAVDCGTNILSVSWAEADGADSYMATVQDSNGLSTACHAMAEGFCDVDGLACGQIYHVTVVSSDGVCDSPPTDAPVAYSGMLCSTVGGSVGQYYL